MLSHTCMADSADVLVLSGLIFFIAIGRQWRGDQCFFVATFFSALSLAFCVVIAGCGSAMAIRPVIPGPIRMHA